MHSHIPSLTPDSYFLESHKRIWDKAGGLIPNNSPELYQWLSDFSLQHLLWNNVFSQNPLKYGTGIYQYVTFKNCFGFNLLLPLQDQFQKLCLERIIEDLQQRSYMKKDRRLQKQTERSLKTRKKYVGNQWVIAEKPLKKTNQKPKKVINKVWQYLKHPEKKIQFEYFVGQICSITSDITIPSQRVRLTC